MASKAPVTSISTLQVWFSAAPGQNVATFAAWAFSGIEGESVPQLPRRTNPEEVIRDAAIELWEFKGSVPTDGNGGFMLVFQKLHFA